MLVNYSRFTNRNKDGISQMSQIDVEQLQVLYRIIFGTDSEPKWVKKSILHLEG
jgi:hypothetical protein